MKITLCFSTAFVLLCSVKEIMSHQDQGKNPYSNQGTSGKTRDFFHDSKNADHPVLIKSGSPLQGRTIYKTAWSEEMDRGNSEEISESSDHKMTFKSENTWNLADIVQYILSFVYQNENLNKHDPKKPEMKNYTPERNENMKEFNKNSPSFKTFKNNTENSGSIPTNNNKENFSIQHNYLEYYFQNNDVSSTESEINDDSDDGGTNSSEIASLDESSYGNEDSSFEASEVVDDMKEITVVGEKDIEVADEKDTDIVNEEDIEVDEKDTATVNEKDKENVDGEDTKTVDEKDIKEPNYKVSKLVNRNYSPANSGGDKSDIKIFTENVDKSRSSSTSDIKDTSTTALGIETENEMAKLAQSSPKMKHIQSIPQNMKMLADIDKKKQFDDEEIYDSTDTASNGPTNNGLSLNENNKKTTKNSQKEDRKERKKKNKKWVNQFKDLNGNITNEEISSRNRLKLKKETDSLDKEEQISNKTFSFVFETSQSNFYKDTTTEIPKKKKRIENDSENISVSNNYSKDKIVTMPKPFIDVGYFHNIDENPKENLPSKINKPIQKEDNENRYRTHPTAKQNTLTQVEENSFEQNESLLEATSFIYTTIEPFKYDAFNIDIPNSHSVNTSSHTSTEQGEIHTDKQEALNIPKESSKNTNDATHIGKENSEEANTDFNAQEVISDQKTINTSQTRDEKMKEGNEILTADMNSFKNRHDDANGTFAIYKSNNEDQLYEYVLAPNEFIEMNEPYIENTEDIKLEKYDLRINFDTLQTDSQKTMHQKEKDNDDESQEYFDTILEYLYKNSNNSFIQSLKAKPNSSKN